MDAFEEQEQLEELKYWWKTYRAKVVFLVTVVFITVALHQIWHFYQSKMCDEASDKYQVLLKESRSVPPNISTIAKLTRDFRENYANTPYAGYAHFISARIFWENKKFKEAEEALVWVKDHVSEPKANTISILQIAEMQFQHKKYEPALKNLSLPHDASFNGLFADLRGDILSASGKKQEAKLAYQESLKELKELGEQNEYAQFVQSKLEAL